MIHVLMKEVEDSLLILVKGHSTIGKEGQDMLCAAVSGQVGMLEIGINLILNLKAKIKSDKGYFLIPPMVDKRAHILMKAFFYSIKVLEKQYPKQVQAELKIAKEY